MNLIVIFFLLFFCLLACFLPCLLAFSSSWETYNDILIFPTYPVSTANQWGSFTVCIKVMVNSTLVTQWVITANQSQNTPLYFKRNALSLNKTIPIVNRAVCKIKRTFVKVKVVECNWPYISSNFSASDHDKLLPPVVIHCFQLVIRYPQKLTFAVIVFVALTHHLTQTKLFILLSIDIPSLTSKPMSRLQFTPSFYVLPK